MNILCFLIPAIVGIIAGILGYLLGKMRDVAPDADTELQIDHTECKEQNKILSDRIASLDQELALARSSIDALEATLKASTLAAFDPKLAFSVMRKKIKQDDLKVVEGIGPKIEALYHAAGITTWKQLAGTPVEQSRSILLTGGRRFVMHNPETWAQQAELAVAGKWQELKEWQNKLHGGRK